ncbi:MAG: hypothetical protein COT67_01415 [Candidatus Tagabacteria bacterium CG09_land_8_20_14_0_10_41_14]|uniref:Uncharacterized protein n=1 Tax=Candidatus Tagabacteria bacterium CG09_land_8_20_14_0_10_41_14 TaxID=1975021 RepID=A0A2H0WNK7_9BACT|nr:MAG: hypothetical protein COT67_01415 [Candidatus Tagabacteria bacterium CG09_land_8_20_14_0_10_41_14]
MENELTHKNYLSRIFSFYFAPVWQSALTILYLLFFLYFAVFYVGNVWLALKFIWYTIINSGALLGLSYLFWGVIFLITLIIPFSISLYSMLLFYEIWHKNWEKKLKMFGTVLIILLVPLIIVVIDEILRVVVGQDVLSVFVSEHNLNLTGD